MQIWEQRACPRQLSRGIKTSFMSSGRLVGEREMLLGGDGACQIVFNVGIIHKKVMGSHDVD